MKGKAPARKGIDQTLLGTKGRAKGLRKGGNLGRRGNLQENGPSKRKTTEEGREPRRGRTSAPLSPGPPPRPGARVWSAKGLEQGGGEKEGLRTKAKCHTPGTSGCTSGSVATLVNAGWPGCRLPYPLGLGRKDVSSGGITVL